MEPSIPEARRALIQRRVALFGAVFGAVNVVGLLMRGMIMVIYEDELSFMPTVSFAFQGVAIAGLLGMWFTLHRGRRSLRVVRLTEMLGLVTASAGYGVVAVVITRALIANERLAELFLEPGLRIPAFFSLVIPLVGVTFVLTYAMVIRAAFVPTSPRYTATLTILVGAPLPLIGFWIGEGTDAYGLALLESPMLALGGALPWILTTAVCAAVSNVVYGLHEEVSEARRLGQYTLEELIGEGGMGLVYRATHVMLRRPTAVKLLPPGRAGLESIERFEREVQLTSELTHPNTIKIFDYGRTADGVFYYAMELLDGATLEEIVKVDGAQPPARVAHMLYQVAGALNEAHGKGLIHRDVKPANIILCRQGGEMDVAKVVDFGLVKELEERHPPNVSQEGTISGTPLYMAPESITQGAGVRPSADIYALGCVAYYLLTGDHVFDGTSVVEVLSHHLHTEPVPVSLRLGDPIAPDLEELVMSCLAKDPNARPTAVEIRSRLEEAKDVPRWSQRSAELWWAAHAPLLEARRLDGSAEGPPHASKTTMVVNVQQRA